MLMLALLATVRSQCTTNAMRDIYSSSDFIILTITNPDYTYIYDGTLPRVTTFTQITNLSSTNFCTNNTKILGSIDSFCCSNNDTLIIADQFFAKYVYGLYIKLANQYLTLAASYYSLLVTLCPIKSGQSTTQIDSKIATEVNRSIYGIYYSVGKIALAAQPWAQSETCLICADDATISSLYPDNTLSANKDSWNTMTEDLGKAAYSGLNALYSYLDNLNDVYKKYIDSKTKASTCDNYMKNVPEKVYWCNSNSDCTTYMTQFWKNTALEYQTFVAFLDARSPLPTRLLEQTDWQEASSNSLLGSRLLTTTTSKKGVGFSTFPGFTNQILVQDMNLSSLEEAHSMMVMTVLLGLLAILL